MYCKLSLPRRSSSSSSSSLSLNTPTFLLLGKSIVIEQQHRQCDHETTTSENKTLINDNTTNENPMRHIKRIRQLFLPVCAHGAKYEIANHYKDVKNRKATKEARAKAKLYRQQQQQHQQQLLEQRKKPTFSKLVSTAIVHRRRPPLPSQSIQHLYHHRQFILCHQRDVLQIPSFTFPR